MSRRSNKSVREKSALPRESWWVAGICLGLAGITWLVYGQTIHHEFVNFDDDAYLFQNPAVSRGLTHNAIIWAFTRIHAANWHPLTWLSHMLDCQLYGLNAGGHHLTNLLLHAATTIFLFLVLRRVTGHLWRSAFVAAVFAIHPLHVESVAWAAERKDVLSAFFFVLTIGAYIRYIAGPRLPGRYALILLLFVLGLMSKPMLVTLPLVLLLLDYWPLHRFTSEGADRLVTARRLILEKLPLFGLAAASCITTLFAQSKGIRPLTDISVSLRLGNAAIATVVYLRQMFWPTDLAVLYPFDADNVTIWRSVLSMTLIAGVTAVAFIMRRKRPYVFTGWLWYLVMLGPVIGILQVGNQAYADRYTYLPQIGLYVLLAWAMADLTTRWKYRRVVLASLSAIILSGLTLQAHNQVSYWKDSETLWTHEIASATDNAIAEGNLGNALYLKGKFEQSIVHFQKALLADTRDAFVQSSLGAALLDVGLVDQAAAHLQIALEVKPDSVEAQSNLGLALFQMGRLNESVTHLEKALAIDPDYENAHYNLGNSLLQLRRITEALAHYKKALQINPDDAEILNNMAWVLATCPDDNVRDGAKAVELAERADNSTGRTKPRIAATVAAAYAETGRFADAVQAARRAIELAVAEPNDGFADSIREQLQAYEAGAPFRDRRLSSLP
jgi:tetratricopeptide (TPR) repeat protein